MSNQIYRTFTHVFPVPVSTDMFFRLYTSLFYHLKINMYIKIFSTYVILSLSVFVV